MKKLSGKTEYAERLSGEIFVLFSSKSGFDALILTPADLDNDVWLSGFLNFTCKVIGPKKFEEKIRSQVIAKNGSVEKFVERDRADILFNAKTGRLQIEKANSKKIRVAIVDDSKTIRQILRKIFSSDSDLEVVGDFENPLDALSQIKILKPDVITLDIHMPDMDGVAFLNKLMPTCPIPTIMISSISMEEGPKVLSALEAGAVDYIQKPSFEQIPYIAPLMIEKIKVAASAKTKNVKKQSYSVGPVVLDKNKIFAIGSSTGGTEALRELLTALPSDVPPILIVQHIPAVFSKAFADRMNTLCKFSVTEAVDGDVIKANHCYIAPGGLQMSVVQRSDGENLIKIEDSAPVNRHKPSVDVLFDSVAKIFRKNAVGVILTGMGADGAKGLLQMRNANARTYGQNEETCVVYGMPQAAKKIGAVEFELPLQEIASAILNSASVNAKKKAS